MKAAPNIPQKIEEKGKKAPQTIQKSNKSLINDIAGWWIRFDRFGWDILGVILIAISLVTLMGLLQITKGVFITPWTAFLTRWLGWGGILISLIIGGLGIVSLQHNQFVLPRINLSKILALEGWVFVVLTILAVYSGRDLEKAESGSYGGLIGWGLAEWLETVIPAPWSTTLLVILFVIFALVGFGIIQWLIRRFETWLFGGETPSVPGTSTQNLQPFTTAKFEPEAAGAAVKNNLGRINNKPTNMSQISKPAMQIRRDERLPPFNLLMHDQNSKTDEDNIHLTAARIEQSLGEFGIPSRVVGYRVGPTVTQFAVEPGYTEKTGPDGELIRQKVKVSQISILSRDLSRALSAERLRIEAPVPGHSFVGIEVPNLTWSAVKLRSILESELFQKLNSPLGLALGRDVSGNPLVADLARMPHILIAGTTGSGKSVCIAALTVCLVVNNPPSDLRLAMLDPKMVELVRFNGLPHLMGKVETKTDRMLGVLRWALSEMDHRYRLLEDVHARDLESYNRKMARKKMEPLPRIVVLIDELADLMMSAPDQTEHSIIRLAQLARATGIHLIVATQRPSTDVVTGLIKANFPARISFAVASSVDSRVILDSNGAESLLGRGDMLFLNPEIGSLIRAQGVIVTDQEVDRIVNYWKKMSPADEQTPPWEQMLEDPDANSDHMIEDAIKIVRNSQHASASLLQRRLRVGYPRAARLIDELEELGVVGPSQGGGREREVLLAPENEELPDEDGLGEYNSEDQVES